MADIYTHLRELGVAFFFFNEKSLTDITPTYFHSVCVKNINISCDLTISMLASNENAFDEKELSIIKNALKLPIIFDGRNQYDKKRLQERGFECYQIGKV